MIDEVKKFINDKHLTRCYDDIKLYYGHVYMIDSNHVVSISTSMNIKNFEISYDVYVATIIGSSDMLDNYEGHSLDDILTYVKKLRQLKYHMYS